MLKKCARQVFVSVTIFVFRLRGIACVPASCRPMHTYWALTGGLQGSCGTACALSSGMQVVPVSARSAVDREFAELCGARLMCILRWATFGGALLCMRGWQLHADGSIHACGPSVAALDVLCGGDGCLGLLMRPAPNMFPVRTACCPASVTATCMVLRPCKGSSWLPLCHISERRRRRRASLSAVDSLSILSIMFKARAHQAGRLDGSSWC